MMTETSPTRVVVIVSGGDAVTPFTTPSLACASGLAAGNTCTALREHLLQRGHTVFTSPAMNSRGPVVDQVSGFGPFGGMPVVLPELMTVNSIGDIDLAGEHLARFFGHLGTEFGVTELDIVAHSMGGLFSRAAIRVLRELDWPLRVRSLTTLGTPWLGSLVSDFTLGDVGLDACAGNPFAEQAVQEFRKRADEIPVGAAQQVSKRYLAGDGGWNAFQAGVLDGIPVTLVGGSYFEAEHGAPEYWPNDGVVSASSATAVGVPDAVLPQRTTLTVPLTHSIFISDAAGLEWSTGMTWNSGVLEAVHDAIAGA